MTIGGYQLILIALSCVLVGAIAAAWVCKRITVFILEHPEAVYGQLGDMRDSEAFEQFTERLHHAANVFGAEPCMPVAEAKKIAGTMVSEVIAIYEQPATYETPEKEAES